MPEQPRAKRLRAALAAARSGLAASTHERRAPLLAQLDALAREAPTPTSATATRVRALVEHVLPLVAAGALPAAVLDALGEALDASLAPRADLVQRRAPPAPRPGPRLAMRSRPALVPGEIDAIFAPGDDTQLTAPPLAPGSPRPPRAPVDPIKVRAGEAAASRPAVRLVEDAGAPLTIPAYRARLVDACADNLAMLAMHREALPISERPDREARMLAQLDALFTVGPAAGRELVALWRRSVDDPNPYKLHAVVLALGCLDGLEPLAAIERVLRSIPPDAADRAAIAADALAAAPNPGVADACRAWLDADHAALRAAALGALSRRSLLGPEALEPHLRDPGAPVLAAAIRALTRFPELPALPPQVTHALRLPVRAVAREAARALLLWGEPAPILDLREERPLARVLGPDVVELYVMAGQREDLAGLEAAIRRLPPTPALLSGIARFGAVGSWAYLAHYLAEPELIDAAARALATLFGPLVSGPPAALPGAWGEALARVDLDPATRVRCGAPWTPRIVLGEIASGELPAAEVRARADELLARTGRIAVGDLDGWSEDARRAAGELAAHVGERRYPAGSFQARAFG